MQINKEVEGLFVSADTQTPNIADAIASRRAFGDMIWYFMNGSNRSHMMMEEKAKLFEEFRKDGKVSVFGLDTIMDNPIRVLPVERAGLHHVFVLLDRTYYYPWTHAFGRSKGLVSAIVETAVAVNRASTEVGKLTAEGAEFMTAQQVRDVIGVAMTSSGK